MKAHFEVEPGLARVFVIHSDDWDDPKTPMKLLEINANTGPTKSVKPYSFTPTEGTHDPTMIAEIAPESTSSSNTRSPSSRSAGLSTPLPISGRLQ